MLAHAPAPGDLGVDPGPIAELELLPGWYDDWVLAVRERLQLRLLHALEALSRLLRRAGRPAAAVEAMHVAVLAEPLRESGQRALIEAHQAAGDWIAARRQYDAFRSILRREIGVEPSPELTAVARARPWPRPGSRAERAKRGEDGSLLRRRCRCGRRSAPPRDAPPRPSSPGRWSGAGSAPGRRSRAR